MPLWELSARLKNLSLFLDVWDLESDAGIEQQVSTFTSFKLPRKSGVSSGDARKAMHLGIVHRTIVSAAQGGELRRISLGTPDVRKFHHPFAIRALLPKWIAVERWETMDCTGGSSEWVSALGTLRPLLAYASLWQDLSVGEIADRTLTCQQVQSLRSYFKLNGFPKTTRQIYRGEAAIASADRYLRWLEEDAELAQQVADAWNVIVRRGRAQVVMPIDQGPPKKLSASEEGEALEF